MKKKCVKNTRVKKMKKNCVKNNHVNKFSC